MAQFRIEIPRGYVAAVARFMAKSDIRYYLNGALLEVHANVAHLVAADGHTLACARIMRNGENMDGQGSAIIPRELLEKIKTKARGNFAITFHVDCETVTLEDGGEKITRPAIDGKFPDWGRVTPAKLSGLPQFFNPDYLVRCKKAAEDLGSKAGFFRLGYNGAEDPTRGGGAAVVRFDNPEVFAVVMPMHMDPCEGAPEWRHDDPEAFGRLALDEAIADAFPEEPVLAEAA